MTDWRIDEAFAREEARFHGRPQVGAGAAGRGRDRAGAGDAEGRARKAAARGRREAAPPARPATRQPKLSKDSYRRQKTLIDDDLNRLGLRKSHLELALLDPSIAANFVELRRVTSELADVDQALKFKHFNRSMHESTSAYLSSKYMSSPISQALEWRSPHFVSILPMRYSFPLCPYRVRRVRDATPLYQE